MNRKTAAEQRIQAHQVALHLAQVRYDDPAAVRARAKARAKTRHDLDASRKDAL